MQGTSLDLMQHGTLSEVLKKQEWLDSCSNNTVPTQGWGNNCKVTEVMVSPIITPHAHARAMIYVIGAGVH